MALKDLIDLGRSAISVVRDFTDLAKAQQEAKANPPPRNQEKAVVEKAVQDPKSLFYDPYAVVDQLGYKDKPTNMTYGTLKAIFYKLPIVQAIYFTRLNQLASFCKPQKNRYSLGFRIRLRDTDKHPTRVEQNWAAQMSDTLMTTGVTDNPKGRDDFETFIKKIMKDSLMYDQMCFEVVPNRKGLPAEWYAVDASTMRIADNGETFKDEDKTKNTRYVQIYDGMIIEEYTQDELCFAVRNPNTDIRQQGYGVSELELLVITITGLLHGHDYNSKFFTQGNPAKGIINFKGVVPKNQIEEFKRQWYSLLSSIENAWKTPIISGQDEIQYINLQTNNRDMEFSAWMDFLIKEACAVHSIDPAEINFQYGNSGQRAALVESSNAEKITASKERGLRPLANAAQKAINTYIVHPINPDFELEFVGLDAETRQEVIDRNTKRVTSFMTVDEVRAEEDLPPLEEGKGDIILNQVYLQNSQGVAAQGAEEEGVDQDGEGEEEPQDIRNLLSQLDEDEEQDNKEAEQEEKEKKKNLGKSESEWIVTL